MSRPARELRPRLCGDGLALDRSGDPLSQGARAAAAGWPPRVRSATHAFPTGFDPFFSEIQQVYDAIGESYEGEWPPAPPDEVEDETAEIGASGLFGDVEVRRYLWHHRYTADEYINLLNTFSGHIAMDPAKRERLDREIRRRLAQRPDARVQRHWQAILHVAGRR